MKGRLIKRAAVCAAFAASIAAPTTAMADYRGYSDIPEDHWAATSHVSDYVVDRGLLTGYSGTDDWGPDDTLTRGQLGVIMYRICTPEDAVYVGDLVSDGNRPFKNVYGWVTGRYYEYAMNWAYTEGLIKGNGYIAVADGWGATRGTWYERQEDCPTYSEPYVRPDDDITREELATMLMRLAQHRGDYSASDVDYAKLDAMADAGSVSPWARESMAWAVGKGIITGKPGNVIDPQGTATRAEAAKMLTV